MNETKSELLEWREEFGRYIFDPDETVRIEIFEESGKWKSRVVIEGQKYSAERPTLEEAYKATSDLLYKKAKKYWLRQDAKAVMDPWAHTLPE